MTTVNIFTEINGVKNYVRRIKVHKYNVVVTMYTTHQPKAFDFKSIEIASGYLKKMGIGKAIEVNEN
ncbi:MAG: hypothetical protein NVS9B7_29250 [Flavisolibacter sp.]